MRKPMQARYTLEFKQEAVGLIQGGQNIATGAKSLAS
jgi:transposase-like protein